MMAMFRTSERTAVEDIEGAHHDPSQRGFTLQNAELTLDGAVDPYFKALATVPLHAHALYNAGYVHLRSGSRDWEPGCQRAERRPPMSMSMSRQRPCLNRNTLRADRVT